MDNSAFATQAIVLHNQIRCRLKKGRSKRAHLLRDAVHRATENFVLKGEEIANENVEVRSEMMTAVNDVRETGGYYQYIQWQRGGYGAMIGLIPVSL